MDQMTLLHVQQLVHPWNNAQVVKPQQIVSTASLDMLLILIPYLQLFQLVAGIVTQQFQIVNLVITTTMLLPTVINVLLVMEFHQIAKHVLTAQLLGVGVNSVLLAKAMVVL